MTSPSASTVARSVPRDLASFDVDPSAELEALGANAEVDVLDALSLSPPSERAIDGSLGDTLDELDSSSPSIDPATLRSAVSELLGTRSIPADPMLFLLSLGAAVARSDQANSFEAANESAAARRTATDEAAEAHRRAAAANRRAHRFLGHAPKWVKKLITTITVALGVLGASFTGGATLGLAIAGAVLMLGAKGFERLARELGMDPSKAKWIGVACQVVGAALMAGSGAASGPTSAASAASAASAGGNAVAGGTAAGTSVAATGAAANTAATSAETAADVVEQMRQIIALVQSAMSVRDGVGGIGATILTHQADLETIVAEGHELEGERADHALEAVLDAIRGSLASFRDVESRTLDILDLEHRRSDAILARAGR